MLEAWAGVPAQRALETARGADAARARGEPLASARGAGDRAAPAAGSLARRRSRSSSRVVAIALWAAPLAAALGGAARRARAADRAAADARRCSGRLRARHLGRPVGPRGPGPRAAARWPRAPRSLIVGVLALRARARPALLAGLLTVTWTGGDVLIRRGWAPRTAPRWWPPRRCLLAGAPALVVVAGVAALVTAARRRLGAARRGAGAAAPGRWSRTLGAAPDRAPASGLLLVARPDRQLDRGPPRALALLPSAAGALWAGQHLWKLARRASRARSPASRRCGAPQRRRAAMSPPPRTAGSSRGADARRRSLARTLAGAARRRRLVAVDARRGSRRARARAARRAGRRACSSGSASSRSPRCWSGCSSRSGGPSWARAGASPRASVPSCSSGSRSPFPGAALLAGGAVALAVLAPAALVLLARPARTLATALWIT